MVGALKIHFPGKLIFGNGSLNSVAEELMVDGPSRILVVTINALLPVLKPLFDDLRTQGHVLMVDTGIRQEPSFQDFRDLMQRISHFDVDIVLGIGGGSALDVAKLVAAQLGNPQQLEDYVGIGLLKGRSRKLICAPATAGTGSEVSPNAILVDDENQKKGIISPFLVPDSVYVDPLLTCTVPPDITAATGLDALTHCLEAYTNKFAQPLVDVYAYEGMRLIAANITKAVQDGTDLEARSQVALGSLLGGFCLGPVNTAGVHALSYPLGSMFHLSHGLSNALLLPYVMEFNVEASPQRYANVAVALGCSAGPDELATARKGIERIKTLIKDCGIPERLSDLNIPETAIPDMARDAMKVTRLLKNNPREIREEDAISIYQAAY